MELADRLDSFSLDVRWGICDHIIQEVVAPILRSPDASLGETFDTFWMVPIRYPMIRLLSLKNEWDGTMENAINGVQSYTMVTDTRRLSPYNQAIKLTGITCIRPQYNLVYLVDSLQCPRCSFIDNTQSPPLYVSQEYVRDLTLNSLNYFNIVKSKYKLAMDIEKLIRTDFYRSYYSWYGTKIVQMSKEKFINYSQPRVVSEVLGSLDKMRAVQNKRRQYQKLPDNEILGKLLDYQVNPGFTSIDIDLKFNTLGMDKFSINFGMQTT